MPTIEKIRGIQYHPRNSLGPVVVTLQEPHMSNEKDPDCLRPRCIGDCTTQLFGDDLLLINHEIQIHY